MMLLKILYTIFILIICIIICIIICLKGKDKTHSLTFTIVMGIITTIIGNLLIPSNISLFDIFEHTKENSNETEDLSPEVTLNLKSLDLVSTDEYDLTATTLPNAYNINWSSNNKNIVTVDSNGHLKAVAEGNATITASITYKDTEYSDACNVSVKSPSISLDPPLSLYIGETENISVNVFPENASIIWENNNPEIVSLDDNGEIKGNSEGIATITASIIYNNFEYYANCDIEVKAPKLIEKAKENIDNQVVPLTDVSVTWLQEENVYKETSQKTVREDWGECIRFGSSNLNADGDAYIIVACDQKYSKFTAEIAPQEGFDTSDHVVLIVYGVRGDEQISKEEYSIDLMSRNTEVEIDITGADELYIVKDGDYNMGKIAGQYINGYTGMGVLMRNAVLHK